MSSATESPSMEQKIKENNCPECLFLDLEEKPVGKKGFFGSIPNKIDLHFTISFNQQWQDIGMGRVKFGIRGGELRLKLNKGNKIPYKSRNFNDFLLVATDSEVEIKQGRESISGVGASLATDKAGLTAKGEENQTASRQEKFHKTTSYISTKGSEEEPIWVFETNRDVDKIIHSDHFFVLKREQESWAIIKMLANETDQITIKNTIEQELSSITN